MFNEKLQAVLKSEMNRKQFLTYVGTIVLAVIGVTGFIKILTQQGTLLSGSSSHSVRRNGYGDSGYNE